MKSDDDSTGLLKAVGRRVQALRAAKGLNQGEFGRRAGMRPDYAWRIEEGRQNLSLLTLAKVAHGLEISLSELFDGIQVDPDELKAPVRGPRKNDKDQA